ncbi:MAG: cell division protein FtsB [Gammaproteobacteria bacterium]
MLRVFAVILAAVLLALQFTWWFGKGGRRDVHRLESQIRAQEQALESLRQRNAKLAAEVVDLKEGLDTVEEIARSEMGMIREGEIFYQMIETPPPAPAATPEAADE